MTAQGIIEKVEVDLAEAFKNLAEAKKLLAEEKTKPKPKAWVRGNIGLHYQIEDKGTVEEYNTSIAPAGIHSYPTREVAEAMRDWLKVQDKLRVAADGFVPKYGVGRYSLMIDNETLRVVWNTHCIFPGRIFFKTKALAQAALDSLTEEEKEVYKKGLPVY